MSQTSSSTLRFWLLIDGAVAAGHAPFLGLLALESAIPLYDDLGPEASSVGPWLLPDRDAGEIAPLPFRHGLATLKTAAGEAELVRHFQRIRHLCTDDGQRFFFRFADTRALAAAECSLPERWIAMLKGPMTEWAWHDRHGAARTFAPAVQGLSEDLPSLTLKQFESLVLAGLPDQLAMDLESMQEPGLRPAQDAVQFGHLKRAIAHAATLGETEWRFQRAIARLAVLSEGGALEDQDFSVLLAKARKAGDASQLENLTWPLVTPSEVKK